MSPPTTPTNPWPDQKLSTADGRRQRSDRSRRRIIEAMFDLLREGEMSPGAARVAERANVGLRTVFRHFEDMDSIFEEMTEELRAVIMPVFQAPLEAKGWRDQLIELAERHAQIFERVFPMQVALVVRRFESDFLQRQYQSQVDLLHARLQEILPRSVTRNRALFAAIEVNLTFATWRRLREDQNLSVKDATDALKLVLTALIADHDDA